MREYKFRAWDRYYEVMIDWEQYKGELVSNDFIEHGKGPLFIMQYTGLKDINGKEIYEGDICKLSSEYYYANPYFCTEENWEMTCVVKFASYMYFFREVKDKYKEILLWEANENDTDVEIIGNIYENPELMNR